MHKERKTVDRMKSERFDTIAIPDSLSQRVRKGIRQGEKIYMRNRRKRIMIRFAAAAAALFVCMGIFASQPALASKIPVIRNIFKFLQKITEKARHQTVTHSRAMLQEAAVQEKTPAELIQPMPFTPGP